MYWVNEKRVGDKMHTLYRNEKRELVLVIEDLDEKGNRKKPKKGEKVKEKKVTRKELLLTWR